MESRKNDATFDILFSPKQRQRVTRQRSQILSLVVCSREVIDKLLIFLRVQYELLFNIRVTKLKDY